MTTTEHAAETVAWHALSAEATARRVGVDPGQGLGTDDAARRLAEYGPNQLPSDPPPSRWAVARGQLANPNIMLLIVALWHGEQVPIETVSEQVVAAKP